MTDRMPPARIGSYQVQRELACSGSGITYLAYDEGSGNQVVLKVLQAKLFLDKTYWEQFLQDMQTLAISFIPGIVPISDLNHIDDQYYLVTPFLPGGSLADILSKGVISLEDAKEVVCQLAEGLDTLHSLGILHLNIKPSNILFDVGGQAKLIDCSQVPRGNDASHNIVNRIDGQPMYMSPEQVLGRSDLDGRSDIYSLCAVALEMLTGKKIVSTETPIISAVEQVCQPQPEIRLLAPELPAACADVLSVGLSKNPVERFSSAVEFANAFSSAIELPEQVGLTDALSILAQPVRPRRLRWIILLLLILIFTGAFAGFYYKVFDVKQAQANIALGFSPLLYVQTDTPVPIPPTVTPTPTSTSTHTPIPTATASLTSTPTPSPTLSPTPSPTKKPTITPTATPIPLVIGMADKIAYLSDNEIWVANLDGSNLERLTKDGKLKTDLQWTPDSKGLIYSTSNCYYYLSYPIMANTPQIIGCFGDFEMSSDMTRVVVGGIVEGLNKTFTWRSFIGILDFEILGRYSPIPTESILGGCPYEGGRQTRISNDQSTMAAIVNSVSGNRAVDIIQVFRLHKGCQGIEVLDNIPGSRFTLRGYSGSNSKLTDFGWDGENLFALHGNLLNGYGDLVIYNRAKRTAKMVNPIGEKHCCYQDIQFSPDGQYILFVYQDIDKGKGVDIYYIPMITLETGASYQPLNLPQILVDNPKDRVEPALREFKP